MLNWLVYFLVSLIISSGNSVDTLTMYNGIQIDNISTVSASESIDMWFLSMDNGSQLIVIDPYNAHRQYRAYEISPQGIERINF